MGWFDETMELGEDILTLGGVSREKAAAGEAQRQAQQQAQAIANTPEPWSQSQVSRDYKGGMTEYEYNQAYKRHTNDIKSKGLNVWGNEIKNPFLNPPSNHPPGTVYDPNYNRSGYNSPELAAYGDIWNNQGDSANINNPDYTPFTYGNGAGNLRNRTNQQIWDDKDKVKAMKAEERRRKNNPTGWESVKDGLWSGAKAIADPFYEDSGEFANRMGDVETARRQGKWVNSGDYKDWQKYNGY